MTCPPVDIWIQSGWNGTNVNLQRYSPGGSLISTTPVPKLLGDIAWSADGTTLYGVEFYSPTLYTIDPVSGAATNPVPITGTSGSVLFNALTALPNGNLLAGNYVGRMLYEVNPTSGAATPFAEMPAVEGVFGTGGDIASLSNGEFLAFAFGSSKDVALRIHPDRSMTMIGTLPKPGAWGAAPSGGQVFLAEGGGKILRLDQVPTAESNALLPTSVIAEPGVELAGASSIQDSGLCNIEPNTSYSVSKTQSPSGAVAPGTVVTYTISVKNTGSVAYPATAAGFADDLSKLTDDATFVAGSAQASAGQVTVSSGTLSWIGPLAAAGEPGSSVTVSYSVRVNDPDNGDHKLTNIVTPIGAGGSCAIGDGCLTEASVSSAPPPGGQGAAPTKKKKKHHMPKKPGKPRLVVEKTASTGFARPSSVVGYKITVWNKGDGAARAVKVCDEPPSSLTILRSEPAASGKGSTCWRLKSLAAESKRVFRVTAQVAMGADAGMQRNVATVNAANVKGVRTASAGVRVKPLPNAACGSRAFRPAIAPRC